MSDGNKLKDLAKEDKITAFAKALLGEDKDHPEKIPSKLKEVDVRALVRKALDLESTDSTSTTHTFNELMVTWLQTSVLLEAVKLRSEFKKLTSTNNQSATNNGAATTDILKSMKLQKILIRKLAHPSSVEKDLLADLETKMGFLFYERAATGVKTASDDLKEAETHLRNALEYKENWDPAQIYLAQVLVAQKKFPEAIKRLDAVLGVKRPNLKPEPAEDSPSNR